MMKDSWASDTMIQEASLAMELPASPATANDLPMNRITDQEQSRTISQKLPPPGTLDHSKHRGRDSERRTENTVLANEVVPSNQTTQPMDISDNVDCGEDEEQIVPQSVASCKISRQNGSEMTLEEEQREAANVSSRIMKMGLRDLLNEVDHEQGINKSGESKTPGEANVSTSHQQEKKAGMNTWGGFTRQEHVMFGPLSRTTTLHSDNHSAVTLPRNQITVREREGSPVITHKKFDYQKKLTLNSANTTSAPLNLCKRSPSNNTPSSCDVKEESAPIDLTTKKQNKTEYVQCSSFQNPERKSEPWPSAKKNQDYFQSRSFRSPFLFGIKPEPDSYSPPRMPSFLLPRSSSCSPSSASDHSSSSTVSSTEQRSEPETSDVKPNPEILSQINPSMLPPPLRLDQDISGMPRVIPFDPSRVNDFYMQQFPTKLEGSIYPVPMTHFGGYTTATACPSQPLSPSSKNRNQKPDKMFICQECGAVFKHRHHVVRHMRSHSGERPFRCDECGATFARKCILTNHKRTHTGEKPYICTECGDTFSRKHHLVIHRRTHTGEKPYKCLHCGAAFARSHHLNRHRKTHVKLDAQGHGEISRMYLSQIPGGFPVQGMQGLPTMLPILPPNLLPRAMDTTQELNEQSRGDIMSSNLLPPVMDTELNEQSRGDNVPPKLLPKAMDTVEEFNEHNRGDIGDKSQAGLKQGTCETNSEVSKKSTSDNIGAKDPASSKNQSLSD